MTKRLELARELAAGAISWVTPAAFLRDVARALAEALYLWGTLRDVVPRQTRVVRGGSWRETEQNARVSKRFAAKHWRTDITIGIRCAADLEQEGDPSAL